MREIINVQNLDGQLLVNSRDIAEAFEKYHKNIIQSIENIKAENSAVTKMFIESSYVAGTGKSYKEYLMNRDGFSLLVMGFTGSKALSWKIKYIEAFNKMEEELKNPFSSMSKELQAIFVIDKKQKETEKKVDKLYNIMTIDYNQQENIRTAANRKAIEILGGRDKLAYKRMNRAVFQAMWRDYKGYFKVNSYKNTATKDYEKAIDYVERWQPNTNLILAIEELNNQLAFA